MRSTILSVGGTGVLRRAPDGIPNPLSNCLLSRRLDVSNAFSAWGLLGYFIGLEQPVSSRFPPSQFGACQLVHRLGEPVRKLNVLAAQLAHDLHIVIARHATRHTIAYGAHDRSPHSRRLRAKVHEVAEEQPSPLRLLSGRHNSPVTLGPTGDSLNSIPERFQHFDQLINAAVNVADDVERAVLVLLVVPQRRPLDGQHVNIILGFKDPDVSVPLTLERLATPTHATTQRGPLIPDDMRNEVTVWAIDIAVLTHPLRQIQTIATGRQ